MDTAFRIPGTGIRFGLDPLLGVIPGAGDVTGAILSSYVILEAVRSGASAAVLLRMLANVGIDTALSLVPLLGDLLDVGWKSNTRNFALLQKHLADPSGATAASRAFITLLFLTLVVLVVATAMLAIVAMSWIARLLNQLSPGG